MQAVPQDKAALRRNLETEARRCQWLVLWLDCDREGENISFEVGRVLARTACTVLRADRALRVFAAVVEMRAWHLGAMVLEQPP